VRQEDLFFSQLTVRETLSLAAELQLPKTWKSKARERYVEELLYRLGLVCFLTQFP
jgi:ABC-type multidrug transport system ATPase subunit